MQHQPLARIEADAKAPLLPAHLVALDGEARAVRLHDLQRLYVVAESAAVAGRVVAVLHRDVGLAIIVDAQNLGPVEIDHGAKPLDRMGVAVVVLLAAIPAERMREPAGPPRPAGRNCRPTTGSTWTFSMSVMPRLASAARKRGSARATSPTSVMSSIRMRGRTPGTCRQSTTRSATRSTRASKTLPLVRSKAHTKASRAKAAPGLAVVHHALVRFVQADGLEHHARPEIVRCAHSRRGAADLVRRQRVQRMLRRCNGASFCNGIQHEDPLDVLLI